MRVVVDASCWTNRRGFGRFTRCLVDEMLRRDTVNEYCLLIDSASRADPALPPLPDGADIVTVPVRAAPSRAAAASGSRSVLDIARMSRGLRHARADVVFFPASYTYFPVVGAPAVVTVHDAIAERLPELTLASRRDRLRWRLKQAAALRQADSVLTVSAASRQAIIETLGVADDRICVIREAPSSVFRSIPDAAVRGRLEHIDLIDPYFLYVGGISPHKNLGVLVQAFASIAPAHPALRLVLVGDLHDDPYLSAVASLRKAIAKEGLGDRIVLTGFVSDDLLVALYCGAIATVLPSLAEGFGLTAAESAACATPVVASRDPALIELLGDAGLYAGATDPTEWSALLGLLAGDAGFRAEMSKLIAAKAAGWSWSAAADDTVALLEQTAKRGR